LTEFRIAFERTIPLSVFAICGSCSALGSWNPQAAVVLQTDDCELWKATIELPRGVPVKYRYFKGYFLEPKVYTDVLLWVWMSKLRVS
uniref:CBM20 domain-containing protein n=1 Tax=Pavo cristatus TaxID=9049 RepID=A0A8C9FXI9_PAVCR